jgi:hypothetical protein
MNTIKMPGEIDHNRRRFLGEAAIIAAAQLSIFRSAGAQSIKPTSAGVPAIKPGTNTSFLMPSEFRTIAGAGPSTQYPSAPAPVPAQLPDRPARCLIKSPHATANSSAELQAKNSKGFPSQK